MPKSRSVVCYLSSANRKHFKLSISVSHLLQHVRTPLSLKMSWYDTGNSLCAHVINYRAQYIDIAVLGHSRLCIRSKYNNVANRIDSLVHVADRTISALQ